MTESKISATERLRREGRWDEASCYRDDARKKYKAEGMARTEANDAAWEAMIKKFSPLPVDDSPDESLQEMTPRHPSRDGRTPRPF